MLNLAAGDGCQLTTLVVVIVGSRAVGSLGSQSVGIVGICPGARFPEGSPLREVKELETRRLGRNIL